MNSPHVLQISGIGPAEHLRSLGIEVLADMPEEKAAAPAPKNDAQAPKGKDGAAADFVQTMNTAEHPEAGSPAAKTEEQARADRRKNAAMAAGRLRAVE